MKTGLLTFMLLVFVSQFAVAQAFTIDMNRLKTEFAGRAGISVNDIKSAEVLTFGDQHFAYVKYTKDGRHNTTATALQLGGPGGYIPGSFEITCTGVGCAECDIEGLPNPANVHCLCVRPMTEGGYCNMTKSIKIGG